MRLSFFFLLSLAINLPLSVVLCLFLPKGLFNQDKLWTVALFATIAVCIPALGTLMIIIATVLLYWFRQETLDRYIKQESTPFFPRGEFVAPPNYGEGDARRIVFDKTASLDDRMEALAAINMISTKISNQINRALLREKSPELRLFAYTLLNSRGKTVNEKINRAINSLKNTKKAHKKMETAKVLAFLYWELFYSGLVVGELKFEFEKQFEEMLLLSQNQLKEDSAVWVLSGRYYFSKKDYQKARTAFEKAMRLKAPYTQVMPYLAEINFIEKRYADIPNCVCQYPAFYDILKLNRIAKFWGKS